MADHRLALDPDPALVGLAELPCERIAARAMARQHDRRPFRGGPAHFRVNVHRADALTY
jgi:hypothetical protein